MHIWPLIRCLELLVNYGLLVFSHQYDDKLVSVDILFLIVPNIVLILVTQEMFIELALIHLSCRNCLNFRGKNSVSRSKKCCEWRNLVKTRGF